jgi:WD40 repeat protein
VVFSPDGKTLALGSFDETIRLWDLATDNCQQTLKGIGYISALAFSRDGRYLETNRGILALDSDTTSGRGPQKLATSGLFVDEEWVTWNGKRLLWVPRDWKFLVAVHDHTVVLGDIEGHMMFIRFSLTDENAGFL